MKVTGFERSDFTLKDTGERVTGFNVYLSRTISSDRGRGQAVERVYMSDRKLTEQNINLEALHGKDVIVSYSRYGKVQNITLA